MKDGTRLVSVSDLRDMYLNVLAEGSFQDFGNLTGTVFDLLVGVCEEICALDDDNLSLEQKIALSIGIRLAAESCLIQKIADPEYVANISKNQTGKLIRKFQRMPNCDQDILRIMKRVSLMTPENIHLNSFMFEPILDMSGHHLKSLYADVQACGGQI